MHIPGVFPEKITLFSSFQISETLRTAFVVTIIIVIAAVILRLTLLRRLQSVPKGAQNVLELCVESVSNFTHSILGDYGKSLEPYIFTLFTFIICTGLAEYLGIRSPATDLNCTIGMALITFVLIIAYSIRFKGVKGWLKTYAEPTAVMLPINLVSAVATPVSLACRLFGNMFSGLVVMDMLYSAMGYFAIGIPAIASVYFILFHLGMQSYVFTMLTMSFMKEKLE